MMSYMQMMISSTSTRHHDSSCRDPSLELLQGFELGSIPVCHQSSSTPGPEPSPISRQLEQMQDVKLGAECVPPSVHNLSDAWVTMRQQDVGQVTPGVDSHPRTTLAAGMNSEDNQKI